MKSTPRSTSIPSVSMRRAALPCARRSKRGLTSCWIKRHSAICTRSTRWPPSCERRIPADARESSADSLSLIDIAHTLQVGREGMECRLAIEAATLDELAAGLRAYLAGQHDAPGIHTGQVSEHREVLAPLDGDSGFCRSGEPLDGTRPAGEGARPLGEGTGHRVAAARRRADRPVADVSVRLPALLVAGFAGWDGERRCGGSLRMPARAPGGESLLERRLELERRLARLIPAQLREAPAGRNGTRPRCLAAGDRWAACRSRRFFVRPSMPIGRGRSGRTYKRDALSNGGPSAQITLAETTLRALPRILTGAEKATSVMFPAGAMHLVEDVYEKIRWRSASTLRSPPPRTLSSSNGSWRTESAKLRIMEIGAGTGATSEAVFQALAPCRDAIAEYCSRMSPERFSSARNGNSELRAACLRTALFDVEKPPADQNIAVGAYDLVIAANVLHATRDMRQTVANVRATMRADGLLLLNETSAGISVHSCDLRVARRLVAVRGPCRANSRISLAGARILAHGAGGLRGSVGLPARPGKSARSGNRSSQPPRAARSHNPHSSLLRRLPARRYAGSFLGFCRRP